MGISNLTPRNSFEMTFGCALTGVQNFSANNWVSPSSCPGGGFLTFGNSGSTLANDSNCGFGYKVIFANGGALFNEYTRYKTFDAIQNSCGDEQVGIHWQALVSGQTIAQYCGEDICIKFAPYLGSTFAFYLKGGKTVKNQNNADVVDTDNPGCLYYCGKGSPTPSGIELVKAVWNGSSFTYTNAGKQSDNIKIHASNGFGSPYRFNDCSADPLVDDDGNPSGGGDDEDDDSACDNCYLPIEVCCNDDIFTSDVNDFSSLESPDTYINPETGTEERTPYNGLLRVLKTLNSSFKAYYAYLNRVDCIRNKNEKEKNKQLKRIADYLEEMKAREDVNQIFVESNHSAYVGKAQYMFTDSD